MDFHGSGAQILVESLHRSGVDTIFGLPGDTGVAFYDALFDADDRIRHILARDERSAAMMADAYARCANRVGVVEASSGGGTTFVVGGLGEAYAASVQAGAAVITALNEQVKIMEARVSALFRRHPDAGAYLSQPGTGDITGARIPGEFGDAPGRYASAKARKNYAGTSPLTIASGKKKAVHARYTRNRHLTDALHAQALSALTASPGARRYYDQMRGREIGHEDTLRRVASRLTGILHGCLKTGTSYDEATAWPASGDEAPQAA